MLKSLTKLAITCITIFQISWAGASSIVPIEIVTGVSPGSGVDLVARYLAQELSTSLNTAVTVKNKPGGGQSIAADMVARSSPKPLTLLFATQTFATNPSVLQKLPYDSKKDFRPIAFIGQLQYVIFVNSQLPVADLREFIDLVKNNPGRYNYGSAGPSSLPRLAAEHFKKIVGLDIVHVPFKSASPAVLSLGQGEIQLWIANFFTVNNLIKSQRVKPLAVSGTQRLKSHPDLPTVAEYGVNGYDYSSWYAVLANQHISPSTQQLLNTEINKIVSSHDMQELLVRSGATAGPVMTPSELDAFIDSEMQKYQTIVSSINIK